jgi:hypothetical protein
MRTTFLADDGQHFENEAECREYERLLPVLYEVANSIDELELANYETKSFLQDLKEHRGTSSFERYLFNQRKVFAKLADLLKPVSRDE